MNHLPQRWIDRIVGKIPLRILLIMPFVLQTLAIVVLVGYLSYHSGQKSVANVVEQLMTEVNGRIEQHLNSYLGRAQAINQMNLKAIESGLLDLNDFDFLGKYFYHQIRSFDFAYVNFGSEEDTFIGAGYGLRNIPEIAEIPLLEPKKLLSYAADDQGNRRQLLDITPNSQTNHAAWYSDAVEQGKAVWSSIYNWGDLPDRISLSASAPVYDSRHKLKGVVGIDLELLQISHFLNTLQSSESGRLFIMERSGLMVASTGDEPPIWVAKGKAHRLSALRSSEPLIRDTTQDLIKRFGSLKNIKSSPLMRLSLDQSLFVKVKPYQDAYGLDWLVVMVIPESDFMGEIYANVQKTIVLCGLALLISIALGCVTAQRIAQPILRISRASQSLARGNWQAPLSQIVPETFAIAELKILATSFNEMSRQLQQAFQESEEKFTKIFRASPDLISLVKLADRTHLAVNDQFFALTGYGEQEVIGRTVDDLNLMSQPEQAVSIYRQLQSGRCLYNYEIGLRTRSGSLKTGLLSAELIELGGEQYVLSIIKDISDRKRAEQALQRAKARLRQLNKELKKLANTDYLTQIANRRYFDYQLDKRWRQLDQLQRPLSLILFDIDYFKHYNDTYGHPQGDVCLAQIAQTLQKVVCRSTDLIARLGGGEEFAILLPDTDSEGATVIAQRLQQAIQDLAIPHHTSLVSNALRRSPFENVPLRFCLCLLEMNGLAGILSLRILTLSLGIATLIPTADVSPKLLIEQADKALYSAKETGRNRFVVFSPDIEP